MSESNNILFETQKAVAEILNGDTVLSSVGFLAENARDVDYEIKSHLGKQGLVGLVMTPKARFIGNYMDDCLAWEIEELTLEVVESPTTNRGRQGYVTGQDASMRALDVLCHPLSGHCGQFSPVGYEQGEDGGLLVNKVTMRCALYRDAPKPTAGGKWTFSGGALNWDNTSKSWLGDDFSSFSTMQLSYGDGRWKLVKTTSRGQATQYEQEAPADAKELDIGGHKLTWEG